MSTKSKKLPMWKQLLIGAAMMGTAGSVMYCVHTSDDEPSRSTSAAAEKPNPDRIGGLRVEKNATIADHLKEEGWRLVKADQRSGYSCDSISGMWEAALSWKGVFAVSCNNEAVTYKVEGLGINALVSVMD